MTRWPTALIYMRRPLTHFHCWSKIVKNEWFWLKNVVHTLGKIVVLWPFPLGWPTSPHVLPQNADPGFTQHFACATFSRVVPWASVIVPSHLDVKPKSRAHRVCANSTSARKVLTICRLQILEIYARNEKNAYLEFWGKPTFLSESSAHVHLYSETTTLRLEND